MPHRDDFNILSTIFSTANTLATIQSFAVNGISKKRFSEQNKFIPDRFDVKFLNVFFSKATESLLEKFTSGEIRQRKTSFSNHFHYKPTKRICQVLLCWCFKQKNREIFVNTDDFPIFEYIILLIFNKFVI